MWAGGVSIPPAVTCLDPSYCPLSRSLLPPLVDAGSLDVLGSSNSSYSIDNPTDTYWSMYYVTPGRMIKGTRFTVPFETNVRNSLSFPFRLDENLPMSDSKVTVYNNTHTLTLTITHTLIHSLSLVLVVMTRSKQLQTSRSILVLVL